MATSKQASKHIHVQCRVPSVGITQACSNKVMKMNQEHTENVHANLYQNMNMYVPSCTTLTLCKLLVAMDMNHINSLNKHLIIAPEE